MPFDVDFKKFSLVTLITLMRLPLSTCFFFLLQKKEKPYPLLFSIVFFILLSDFLDGKLARKYRVQTSFGALLDVFCDFFFIQLSGIALVQKSLYPLWYLALVNLKMLEFLITSKLLPGIQKHKHIFLFDKIGRYVAASYYILPILILSLDLLLKPNLFQPVKDTLFFLILFASIVSASYRVYLVSQKKRAKQKGFTNQRKLS